MNKYIFPLLFMFIMSPNMALAAAGAQTEFKCLCNDGTSVGRGEYCPGETTPCGGSGLLKPCLNCVSADWADAGQNREARTVATCDTTTGTCTKSDQARCINGYYGNGLTCARCPQIDGIYGTSVAGDNTLITDCKFPANTSVTDTSGRFTFTTDCAYSK